MKEKQKYLLTILITLFIGIIGTTYVYQFVFKPESTVKTVKDVSISEANTLKSSIAKIYDAVLLIETYEDGRIVSSGTGFIYKKDDKVSYVLTNHHVVDGADQIKVTFNSGKTEEANFKGSDEFTDLAVLTISNTNVTTIATIGDSSKSELGDTVFTVGSPLGSKYMGTVTKGILSGKDRQVTASGSDGNYIMDVLQTDAAINPGNSGGPLLNINGEVIGITSMKLVEDEIEGMGFALPIEEAMSFVDKLETGSKIVRPLIGIQAIDAAKAIYYNSGDFRDWITGDINENSEAKGVYITKVEDNSPASKAKLQAGDVITKIDNIEIEDMAQFRYNLYKHSVGDTISITYKRNDKSSTVKLKLTEGLD